MDNLIRSMPLYVVVPLALILLATLLFVVLKALKEGREISFWPPKVGPRVTLDASPGLRRESQNLDEAGKTSNEHDPGISKSKAPSITLPVSPIAMLRTESGYQPGFTLFLTEEHRELTFGRSLECNVPIMDLAFSRMHFRIVITPIDAKGRIQRDHKIEIVDSGSANGTYINGSRVVSKELKNGDLIQVGGTTFGFYRIQR